MQRAEFLARTDLEIGDKVHLLPDSEMVWEVFDIRTVQFIRAGKVVFEFLLIYNGHFSIWVTRDKLVYPINEKK